jgi:hypothetical protein
MSSRARPRVCLFAGPSLSAAEVQAAFSHVNAEVTMLPPIEQGDILRLAHRLPDVIGIVDGQFFHAPAVLHREILFALERGVRILGAASIGALRAAELDGFGMEGIGQIYRRYRAGTIDSDDEVAVLHGTAADAFRPLTDALVTIRHNLGRARRRGVITPRAGAGALSTMRRLHFPRRTHAALLGAAPDDERAALLAFMEREAVDLKRHDARLLARTIARRIAGEAAWPHRVRVRLNQTSLFHQYRREYVGRQIDGCYVPDDLVLKFSRLLSPSFPGLYARVARRCLILDEAAERGLAPAADARLVRRFRRERNIRTGAALEAWRLRRSLSWAELIQTLREGDLENLLRTAYSPRSRASQGRAAPFTRIASAVAARMGVPKRILTQPVLIRPGVPWPDILVRELKFRGRFTSAVEVAYTILRHNAVIFDHHPRLVGAPVRRGLLIDLAAHLWRIAAHQVEAEMLARGFTGYDDFVEAARHVLVYERTSSGPYRPERLADCFHLMCEEGG